MGIISRFFKCVGFITTLAVLLSVFSSVQAQNKVVVIPLFDQRVDEVRSQYRIAEIQQLSSSDEGRLEYTSDNNPGGDSLWGTVCHDDNLAPQGGIPIDLRSNLGNEICRDMGYAGGSLFGSSDVTGAGNNVLIALDITTCPPNANSVSDCNAPEPATRRDGVSQCVHNDDIGIVCNKPTTLFDHFNFRVVPNSLEAGVVPPIGAEVAGRLEATVSGTSGTVCDDFFADNDNAAQLACTSMGFDGGEALPRLNVIDGPNTSQIILDDVACSSPFNSGSCTFTTDHDCGHHEDVGVACFNAR